MAQVPLFNFAYHGENWLQEIRKVLKPEPWGNLKPLELYLKVNFEIARQQGKVYENKEKGIATWRPRYLVNTVSDPVWLVYKSNPIKNK